MSSLPAAFLPAILAAVYSVPPAIAQAPAADGDIWADFSTGEEHGIKPMHAGGPHDYVEREVEGVRCVATDGASGKHWLCFDIPRSFVGDRASGRYTLIIRYLDQPADGLVTVRYHGARDPLAQAIRFQRQGTGEWQELVLTLPDAVFMNGAREVADFAVHGFTDTGDPRAADVFVSGVWLSKRVLEVSAEPAALPADAPVEQQVSRVRAMAYTDTGDLAPDGTPVRFHATGGTIDEEAQTRHGVAEVTFRADGALGTAVVSADWGVVTGWATIAKVPGDQRLSDGQWVSETFDEGDAADLERVNADTSFAELVEEQDGPAGACLQVHYCFNTQAPGQPHVTYPMVLPVPGRPTSVSLWAKGDGSPHHFQLLIQDAQGTVYTIMPTGRVLRQGWQRVTSLVEAFDDCWGANADGVIDYPVTVIGARLVCLGGGKVEGDIYLDRITAQGLFPPDTLLEQPDLVAVDAYPRSGDALLVPGKRDPLEWLVDNILASDDEDYLQRQRWQLRASPLGRDVEAIVLYKKLVEIAPDNVGYQSGLAKLLYRAGDFEGALAAVGVVLGTTGGAVGSEWHQILRARCLDGVGRREDAAAQYRQVAERLEAGEADHGAIGLALLKAWSERGVKEALPFYKAAPNASPEYVEIQDTALWRVQCSRGQERLGFAIDRNPETFWSPNSSQEVGDLFAIDMGGIELDVARLVLDDDGGTNIFFGDLPGCMVVEGSTDGINWEELARSEGDPFSVIDATWEPRPLRHLRATITEETGRGDLPNWRIYEAYVYRKPPR